MIDRAPVAARKLWWRSTHGVEAGLSTPVFLVGVQRSGTNMVVRGLERSPEVAVTCKATTTANATMSANHNSRLRLMPCPGTRRGRYR